MLIRDFSKDIQSFLNSKVANIPSHESIGIDLGIKDLAICSDGNKYQNINKSQVVKKLENGDIIHIDIPNRHISVDLSDEELKSRKINWKKPPARVTGGYLARYAALVSSANTGAVLKFPKDI